MRKHSFLLVVSLLSLHAHGMDAHFSSLPTYSSGSANIKEVDGGTYVYGSQKDFRPTTLPVAIEPVRRRDYELVTLEEEEALLSMRNKALAERLRRDQVRQRKAYVARVQKMDWPKVVLKGTQICVPDLENSDAKSWKEYLICYTDAEQQQ